MTARRALARASGLALGLSLALAMTLGFVPNLAPVPVEAATPGLTIVGAATYDVLPEEGRVAVTVQLTATNHLKNTVTRRYFFRTAFLTVQPGTSGHRLTGPAGAPKVTVHEATDTYTTLKLDFGAPLAARKTTKLTLTFDIRDAGGEPGRPVRISPSLVTFNAWAFATPETPGSTVAVVFPSGYEVTVGRGPLSGPVPDATGHERWTTSALQAPLDFIADIVADHPSGYTDTAVDVALAAGSAEVLVRAWPDDPAWGDRVANVVEHALPILEREIGVAWPVGGQLTVNEVLVRGSGGFAGVFDPAERRVDISYSATDAIVIHELAHAWFNGRLVADRWAAEAFAAYYADVAARELGLEIRPRDPVEPGVGAIPLNAWGTSTTEDAATELYAYAASEELARQVAERAGADALRSVWARAAGGIGAYQPDASAQEQVTSSPDWRGLLDLLEDQTGADFGDLWRKWVARTEDLPLLDARAAARTTYAQIVEAAGDWRLPVPIRDALRAWRFDVARDLLAEAGEVLAQRTILFAAAQAADIQLSDSVRRAFEGPDGLQAATAETAAELAALEMIAAATASQPTDQGLVDEFVTGVGLLGREPAVDLGAARLALQGGNAGGAYEAARNARDAWASALEGGRARIVSAVLIAIALAIIGGIIRARRRRPAATT